MGSDRRCEFYALGTSMGDMRALVLRFEGRFTGKRYYSDLPNGRYPLPWDPRRVEAGEYLVRTWYYPWDKASLMLENGRGEILQCQFRQFAFESMDALKSAYMGVETQLACDLENAARACRRRLDKVYNAEILDNTRGELNGSTYTVEGGP